MPKILYIIIISILLAVVTVSFLPNLTIFGGTVNIAIIIIARELYRTSAKNRNLWLVLAVFFGLALDLLSGSWFLSATISLILAAYTGEFLKRLMPLEEQIYLAALAVLGMVVVYDLLFLLLNRIFVIDSSMIISIAFDAVLSASAFLFINILIDRFRGNRHQSERIKLALGK